MKKQVFEKYSQYAKMKYFGLLCLCLVPDLFAGGPPQTIGEVAKNVSENFEDIGKLMIGIAYLSGIGFGIAAIFKFKQVKDNPTQIPIGTPFALLMISALLVFLPGLYAPAGETIFGVSGKELDATAGGFEGEGVCGLPGEPAC
ncbi:MAG TPA: type IV secretion protein IcmD [Gammaproteobacteria bacterium]|nr:type IV secretion protein IcmD [Gammaproteobacteria bacterium]